MSGRFAPSPTGGLHLGNLRTALGAWAAARTAGLGFLVRIEDLLRIPAAARWEAEHLADLAAWGITSDPPVVRQSERTALHADAIATLDRAGLLYPCWCTRAEIAAEIAAAASAPQVERPGDLPPDAYPGTCARLSAVRRRALERAGRPAALRLRAEGRTVQGTDLVSGPFGGRVDDLVVRRNDGVPAYALAVVVDDAAQGVTQVVRGDDLLSATPRQILLHRLLGLAVPAYAHLPLVVGADGTRLAKRNGAATLTELADRGLTSDHLLRRVARGLGLLEDAAVDDRTIRTVADLWDRGARLRFEGVVSRPVHVDTLVG